MPYLRSYQACCLFTLLCIFSHFAEARDVSTLQTALGLARSEMDVLKRKHDADVQSVNQRQQNIVELKRQLTESNKQLAIKQRDSKLTHDRYLKAKQKADKLQAELDRVWGNK
ncbi:MAG: hypothetical protein R8K20_03095 [Gallionellaceae bacterium]